MIYPRLDGTKLLLIALMVYSVAIWTNFWRIFGIVWSLVSAMRQTRTRRNHSDNDDSFMVFENIDYIR